MPSPVATWGLVVAGYTCPAPPQASMVARPRKRHIEWVRVSRTSTPKQWGVPATSSVTRSTARWCSKNVIWPVCRAAASSARSISAPVRSAACTMRRSLCPPSRVRWRVPSGLRVKSAPSWTSSSTRAGPSRQTTSTALGGGRGVEGSLEVMRSGSSRVCAEAGCGARAQVRMRHALCCRAPSSGGAPSPACAQPRSRQGGCGAHFESLR